MNKISPKKLLHSKWTAVVPLNKEKHFLIIEVEYDEQGAVMSCLTEAIMSKRSIQIKWRDLKDIEQWVQGWK
ncbi:TIGR02450 family Trp-rich protein [Paraglaciecola sp. MB-3u-78]|uniref:TIGR02450 family Trp-rich protein n=1 Tax=Paraglaciecola sp. MB-3u-78 TaxID=2058332 RepID=UPI000C331BD8|nr:TIGR02450 family Trp-rich protein [Paraglaciecola sp. MB-3u-78]PKH00582.1 TIGR02450 family Trp-rich protein [Paraglaciecola sp. MB-3u-78]